MNITHTPRTLVLSTGLLAVLLAPSVVFADFGDRVEDRLDRRGDRINHRLDRRGARHDGHLDRVGQRFDRRWDRRH